ncbi:unnamed protein product [Allacma fusca]|uniref:Uncharacterized protein n=1 Tax=Allacma fusca TaxID=39272 RepID=A0A8J2PNC8_9HEXA|nr:unnamed protein product [Allacma fusca]
MGIALIDPGFSTKDLLLFWIYEGDFKFFGIYKPIPELCPFGQWIERTLKNAAKLKFVVSFGMEVEG